jgi:hypothetical protein
LAGWPYLKLAGPASATLAHSVTRNRFMASLPQC